MSKTIQNHVYDDERQGAMYEELYMNGNEFARWLENLARVDKDVTMLIIVRLNELVNNLSEY